MKIQNSLKISVLWLIPTDVIKIPSFDYLVYIMIVSSQQTFKTCLAVGIFDVFSENIEIIG